MSRISKADKAAEVGKPAEMDFDKIISAITKEFGSESITLLGSNRAMCLAAQTSGNVRIDYELLGIGGLPRGRIIEVYGPESSGKTSLCLQFIAAAQACGQRCAVIDVEHALEPKHATAIGVQTDKLLLSQPDDGETALRIMESLVRLGAVDVIVLDSVAALITKQELEGQMGDATMGATARLMSQAMRRLCGAVSKSNCTCIFTNQIREKIGVMYGNPETTPGGRALRFFSSVRIDVRRKDTLKDAAGNMTGILVKLKTVKNKTFIPYKEIEVELHFQGGFSPNYALIDVGVEQKIIEKKGAWIAFEGELIGQGKASASETLRANPTLRAKVEQAVIEALKKGIESVVPMPVPEVVPNPMELEPTG